MTTTRTPSEPIVQAGPTGDPRAFTLYVPEEVADLVPAEVLEAVAAIAARETAFAEALTVQAEAEAEALAAPELDAIALAAAIAAGEDDPGPVNTTAAAAAKAEADRLAAGHERAVHDARRALMDVLSAIDRDALVAAADARCASMAADAEAAIRQAAELVRTAADVRRFCSTVAVHPNAVSFDGFDFDSNGVAQLLGRALVQVPQVMWPRPTSEVAE